MFSPVRYIATSVLVMLSVKFFAGPWFWYSDLTTKIGGNVGSKISTAQVATHSLAFVESSPVLLNLGWLATRDFTIHQLWSS